MTVHETNDSEQCIKFISENFDMKCDMDECEVVFASFYDARKHYKDKHNYDYGYIKCCNTKFNQHWMVIDHVRVHLNPEYFK